MTARHHESNAPDESAAPAPGSAAHPAPPMYTVRSIHSMPSIHHGGHPATALADPSRMGPAAVTLEKMAAADRYMEEHFRDAPSLTEISGAAGVSVPYLCRAYRLARGRTVKDRLTELRIEEAKRMLAAGERMANVAMKLAFAQQSHFTSRFRAVTGKTPTAWLREFASRRHTAPSPRELA